MIALISRWKLKNGCPPELKTALAELTAEVESREPGALLFSIHLPAAHPPIGPPPDYAVGDPKLIKPADQNSLTFFEVYRDAQAFSDHLRGPAAKFLVDNVHFFETPWQGHPRPEATFLDPQSVFVRAALAGAEALVGR
jgi:uncharacterized protein